MPQESTRQLVDHLFRHEYGKMVAILIKYFGISHLEIVEDAVQEAFYKALKVWRFNSPPLQPSAWLLQVAKNSLLDHVRQQQNRQKHLDNLPVLNLSEIKEEEIYQEKELADSQLRLIFACCHPSLKKEDQIALTLKTISGFSIKEIASALLLHEETIKKRLQRARGSIISQNLEMSIPLGAALSQRLEVVHTVLYLLFNEGYHALVADEVIRKELCAEAMRLTKLLIEHPTYQSTAANALLSLMCFHAARFESRIDVDQQIILLSDQDRSRWNAQLIQLGHHYLNRATEEKTLSAYHLEAAIAAHHCMAPTFEATNWPALLKLYTLLLQLKSTPIILLNKIVVLIQLKELEEAFLFFNTLDEAHFSSRAYLYFAVGAELYTKRLEREKAKIYLKKAIVNTQSKSEKELLTLRLQNLVSQRPMQ
ncbi:MAG: sigma-70 family RNA polymerase sigma factor [Saprospiraceae bacterium]